MESEDFQGLAAAPILLVARTLTNIPAGGVPQTLIDRLGPNEVALVQKTAQDTVAPANVEDCATRIRQARYERERVALQDEIDRLQRNGSDDELRSIDTLLEQKQNLSQRIDALVR